MSVATFLAEATDQLTLAGIQTARLDCLVLLEDELDQDRALLLAHDDMALTDAQLASLHKKVIQRATHKPLAYIRGRVAFYGRDFAVNEHVLVPRPETESLVDLLKKVPLNTAKPHLADIGTGSGCLAITAALELPSATVDAYDIDPQALRVAEQNVATHHATVHCLPGDLLKNISEHYDVILANLPYVPEHFPINRAATFEPKLALFAGPDGLNLYKRFWQQAQALPAQPRYIITESLPSQHHLNATLARHAGYILVTAQGLAQAFEHA
jgi:release factor glutamine methyltransferase